MNCTWKYYIIDHFLMIWIRTAVLLILLTISTIRDIAKIDTTDLFLSLSFVL